MECAYLRVSGSLRGWNVAWVPSFLFPLLFFPRLPPSVLECRQAGKVHGKDLFQSQQQIPAGA